MAFSPDRQRRKLHFGCHLMYIFSVRLHFHPTGRGESDIWTAISRIYLAPDGTFARQAEDQITFGLPQ